MCYREAARLAFLVRPREDKGSVEGDEGRAKMAFACETPRLSQHWTGTVSPTSRSGPRWGVKLGHCVA